MDSMEMILIVVVVICVIALICIAKKRKAVEVMDTPVADPPAPDPVADVIAPSTDPMQKTIYAFVPKYRNRVCPFCDGENSLGAKTCDICGRGF